MKCSACANNECEGDYENRDKCRGEEEGIECSCYCKETKTDVFFSSVLSIGTGVALTAAGIGLTVATGGLAAVVGGAAITSGGTSLIMSPIQKLVTKECVTFTDSAKDVAIGVIGSMASSEISTAVQIGASMMDNGSVGDALPKKIEEIDSNKKDFKKSLKLGWKHLKRVF